MTSFVPVSRFGERSRHHHHAFPRTTTGVNSVRLRMADGTAIFCTAATDRPWQPGGPTLLGLHGGPGIDGSQLRYFLRPAQEWATVVVPDQRGHGRSDRSTPDMWTLRQWAEDARDLIDGAGLEHVVLVGTSFGGFVAQQFLATYPGVARGAVIVGSSPRRASAEEIVERYREVGGDEAADVMRRAIVRPGPEVEEEWARVCGPLSRIRPPDEELSTIQRERVTTPEVNAHFMETFGDLDLRSELAGATAPMLVLVGEKDPLTSPAVAREIQQHATRAEVAVRVVEGASHQVLWDRPDLALDLLREFVRRVAC